MAHVSNFGRGDLCTIEETSDLSCTIEAEVICDQTESARAGCVLCPSAGAEHDCASTVAKFLVSFQKQKKIGRCAMNYEACNQAVGHDIAILKAFRGLPRFLPIIEEMLELMVQRATILSMSGWEEVGFKPWSHMGFDHVRGRKIDYGNVEYACIMHVLIYMSRPLIRSMNQLAQRWPSLNPRSETNETVEKLGDIVEILMACLRGDALFEHMATLQDAPLPALFQSFCDIMRAVQLLRARLISGHLKWADRGMHRWAALGFQQSEELSQMARTVPSLARTVMAFHALL